MHIPYTQLNPISILITFKELVKLIPNSRLFNNAKSFQKSVGSGTANAPWNWDDKDDGDAQGLLAGGLAYYPAHLVDQYFNNLGNFSKTYIYNPYLGIK